MAAVASNYTRRDTSRCDPRPAIGDLLFFRMTYNAMTRAMASDNVTETVIPLD